MTSIVINVFIHSLYTGNFAIPQGLDNEKYACPLVKERD